MTNILSKPICGVPGCGCDAQRIYKPGRCYANAHYNLENAFKHLGLHPVYGSLGLAGHYEYGGKDWGVKEFAKKPTDSHCWLEDADGNVYDYIFPDYLDFARHWGKTPQFQPGELIGESKKELLRRGLDFRAASPEAQAIIKKGVTFPEAHGLFGTGAWGL